MKPFCKRSPSSATDARRVVACGFLITEALSSLASLSSVCRLPLGSISIYSHDKTSSVLLGAEMHCEPGQLAGPGRPVSRPGSAGGGAELDHEKRARDRQRLPQLGIHRAGGPRSQRGPQLGIHRAGGPRSQRGVLVPPGRSSWGVLPRTLLPEARSSARQSWPCPAPRAQDCLLNTSCHLDAQ